MMLREDAAEGKRVPTFRSFGVQISADTGREIRFRAARTPSVRSFVRYEARHSLLSTGFSFRCSNKNPRDAATRFNRVERRIDAARGTRCRSRIATGEKLSMKHVQTRFPSRKDGGWRVSGFNETFIRWNTRRDIMFNRRDISPVGFKIDLPILCSLWSSWRKKIRLYRDDFFFWIRYFREIKFRFVRLFLRLISTFDVEL